MDSSAVRRIILWSRTVAKKIASWLIYRLPPVPQRMNGRLIWVHPRARLSVSAGTYLRREPHVRKWLTALLRSGDVFFDVGAHHGLLSMWSLTLVGNGGKVHSFEPSPANVHILQWHRKTNQLPGWTIVAGAISDEDAAEHSFFMIDSGDSPMNSLTNGAPGMPLMAGKDIRQVQLQTLTLDTYCQQSDVRPNVLKIDVEGAELLVLRGADKLLREAKTAIILAVHPYWLPAGQSTQQLAQLIESYNYVIVNSQGAITNVLRSGEYLCLPASMDLAAIMRVPGHQVQ